VKELYERSADSITNSNDFVHLLETVNNELYNGHVFLNTNTQSSNRTIPSGSDLKVSWLNRQFVITELREQFNAENCGLKVGMQVIKFDDWKMEDAIKKFLPRSAASIDKEMYEYAANMLLAGTHDSNRKITIMLNGREKIFNPDSLPNKTEENPPRLLEEKLLPGNIGYIKINNSLGNTDLVEAFDNTLKIFSNTIALIIDLRETPSGGTTSVARGIMGCFISKEQPYQKHIYSSEEKETGIRRSALELVTPRDPIYKKPLVVLVGYWTGSMGEGIAIGFDGMKRATIAGTQMAGLLGEIFTFRTPELNIPFSIPCVKLQHINGQPREDFIPPFLIKDQKQALQIASRLLRKK
jgi:carboxyl-terminal processing protease